VEGDLDVVDRESLFSEGDVIVGKGLATGGVDIVVQVDHHSVFGRLAANRRLDAERCLHLHRWPVVPGGPSHCVAQHQPLIGIGVLIVGRVDSGRQVNDPALTMSPSHDRRGLVLGRVPKVDPTQDLGIFRRLDPDRRGLADDRLLVDQGIEPRRAERPLRRKSEIKTVLPLLPIFRPDRLSGITAKRVA
jgi:hypothetical protein